MSVRRQLAIVLVVIVVAAASYVVLHRKSVPATTAAPQQHSVTWRMIDEGTDENSVPHTNVVAVVDGREFGTGSHTGTCTEVGDNGGIDGKGLLPDELSAVQCYFAGGGDEIGVFSENGTLAVKVGQLDEGSAETPGVRGGFTTLLTVTP